MSQHGVKIRVRLDDGGTEEEVTLAMADAIAHLGGEQAAEWTFWDDDGVPRGFAVFRLPIALEMGDVCDELVAQVGGRLTEILHHVCFDEEQTPCAPWETVWLAP